MLSTNEIVLMLHVILVKPCNTEVRWNEHDNLTRSWEPSTHFRNNIDQSFRWTIISNLLKNAQTRQNLISYISLWKADVNEQKNFERLVLFRNDVT